VNLVDTLIYVPETSGPEQREALERRLRSSPGVIAPRFNPGREHLLLVAYNAEQTSSDQLLRQVRAEGVEARLVAF
jgi:hypothetical protein